MPRSSEQLKRKIISKGKRALFAGRDEPRGGSVGAQPVRRPWHLHGRGAPDPSAEATQKLGMVWAEDE